MGNKGRRAHFAVTVKVSGPVTWKLVTGASTLVLALLFLVACYLV
ncbi:hypothetical protein ACGFMK_20365 [Amycolatopsis sp. NPDC049252]